MMVESCKTAQVEGDLVIGKQLHSDTIRTKDISVEKNMMVYKIGARELVCTDKSTMNTLKIEQTLSTLNAAITNADIQELATNKCNANVVEMNKGWVGELTTETLKSSYSELNLTNCRTLKVSDNFEYNKIQTKRRDLVRTKCGKSTAGCFAVCYANEFANNLAEFVEYNSDPVKGDSFTILKTGVYSISAMMQNSTFSSTFWIDKNTDASIDYVSAKEGDVLSWSCRTNGREGTVNWMGCLESGDIIRVKSTIPTNVETSVNSRLNIILMWQC
jgi:hypothetical protein